MNTTQVLEEIDFSLMVFPLEIVIINVTIRVASWQSCQHSGNLLRSIPFMSLNSIESIVTSVVSGSIKLNRLALLPQISIELAAYCSIRCFLQLSNPSHWLCVCKDQTFCQSSGDFSFPLTIMLIVNYTWVKGVGTQHRYQSTSN